MRYIILLCGMPAFGEVIFSGLSEAFDYVRHYLPADLLCHAEVVAPNGERFAVPQ